MLPQVLDEYLILLFSVGYVSRFIEEPHQDHLAQVNYKLENKLPSSMTKF